VEKRSSAVVVIDVEYTPRLRQFPSGRQCAEPLCDTQLSIYNEASYCSLHHTGFANQRSQQRGRKRRWE
jgi:hypothetical protein